jgi:tRNA (cmo5U34)-methyltransferase
MTVSRLPSGATDPAPRQGSAEAAADRLFTEEGTEATDFKFDNRTASVFDDMVSRSVPFYGEIQRMICEMAADFAEPGSVVYDLGCSTATTLLALDPLVDPGVRFVGVDNSPEMLTKARAKIEARKVTRPFELLEADLHDFEQVDQASVVMMVLTLMFIRPLYRPSFVKKLYERLRPGGCLLLVEKLTMENSTLNRLYINYYYHMKKRNNYSEIEIARKRESLENVLIPYRYEENAEMLRNIGFRTVEEFFRWYNFSGVIAIK